MALQFHRCSCHGSLPPPRVCLAVPPYSRPALPWAVSFPSFKYPGIWKTNVFFPCWPVSVFLCSFCLLFPRPCPPTEPFSLTFFFNASRPSRFPTPQLIYFPSFLVQAFVANGPDFCCSFPSLQKGAYFFGPSFGLLRNSKCLFLENMSRSTLVSPLPNTLRWLIFQPKFFLFRSGLVSTVMPLDLPPFLQFFEPLPPSGDSFWFVNLFLFLGRDSFLRDHKRGPRLPPFVLEPVLESSFFFLPHWNDPSYFVSPSPDTFEIRCTHPLIFGPTALFVPFPTPVLFHFLLQC